MVDSYITIKNHNVLNSIFTDSRVYSKNALKIYLIVLELQRIALKNNKLPT